MIEIPAIVEDALLAATRTRVPPALTAGAALAAAVVDRSRRYTTEREKLSTPAAGKAAADLAARALFFTVADAGKPVVVLDELVARGPAGFLSGDRTVLDLGAGCGAMTIGLLLHRAARGDRGALDVTLVDRDADALAIARDAIAAIAAHLGLPCTIATRTADVGAPITGRFDLVLAGTVVNELPDGAALLDRMLGATAPAGVAIVIEPALRATSRALHAFRDALIARGRAVVLAPCTRRGAPCPALADERDWCHDHRPVRLPPRTQQLALATGLRDGELKLAFLALAHPAAAPPPAAAYRVVDDPHGTKGKLELTACGPDGWVPVRLLRRHRSAANRPVERARRGDLLAIDRAPADGAIDLGRDDRVAPAIARRADDDQQVGPSITRTSPGNADGL